MRNVTMASGVVIFGDVCGSEESLAQTSPWGLMLPLLVFVQVCDEPHPLLVKEMIQHCVDANIDEAYKVGLLFLP